MTRLFHREVFMPAHIANLRKNTIPIVPTFHAKQAAENDRYGRIVIPDVVTFEGKDVVEAEMSGGIISKLVIRLPYDATRDAIYVVADGGRLKTVWANLKTDTHKTLRRNLYSKSL